MNGNAQLGIVVTAVDRATRVLDNVDRSTRRLANTFDSFKGRLTNAFQYHVIYRSLNLIEGAIRSAASAIPELVDRGRDWLGTIDDISDATGLSARQASQLAAIQQQLGGSTESLSRGLATMVRQQVSNEAWFRRQGIATRDANGHLLDAGALFDNVRRKTAALGSSQRTTAIAQGAFGRSSRDMLDLLTLEPDAFARATDAARRHGLVVSDAAVAANEAWKRAVADMGAALTGAGTQVAAAVAPALTGVVNGITRFIDSNLRQISSFVVSVVSTVAGVLGGLFGASLEFRAAAKEDVPTFQAWRRSIEQVAPAASKATAATDRGTTAIDRRVAAIDRELAAMDRADRARDRRREQAELLADVAKARKELSDVRSDTTIASGRSEAEAELARQAQARRVADAQKALGDARRAASDAERKQARDARREALQSQKDALQRRAAEQRSADARMVRQATATTAELRRLYDAQYGGGKGGKRTALERELERVSKRALASGRRIGEAITEAIFGKDMPTFAYKGGHIQVGVKREGGLIGMLQSVQRALQSVGDLLGPVAQHLTNLGSLLGPNGPLILGIAALAKVLPLPTGTPTPAPTPGGGGGGDGIWGALVRGGANGAAATMATERFRQGKAGVEAAYAAKAQYALSSDELSELLKAGLKGGPSAVQSALGRVLAARGRRKAAPAPVGDQSPAVPFGAAGFGLAGLLGAGRGVRIGGSQGLGGFGAFDPSILNGTGPGFGMSDPLYWIKRYLGPFSPLVTGVNEGADNSGAAAAYGAETAGNTGPLADDDLGVTNGKFGDIGTVGKWGAGKLGVKTTKNDWPVPSVNVKAIAKSASNKAYDLSINAALIKGLERKGGKLDRIADALYSGGQSVAWYTRYPAGHRPPTSKA